MSRTPRLFRIEPMTPADIAGATDIEQTAYASPPKRDYYHELTHNRLAHYLMLWALTRTAITVGLAGYWLIANEAHIITIATASRWQRRGLGEYLLLSLLEDAQVSGATNATLEVRPSNRPAIALYQKYQFTEAGRRHGYYDNGEDALILTTPPLAAAAFQTMLAQRKQALLHRLSQIEIDKNRPTN